MQVARNQKKNARFNVTWQQESPLIAYQTGIGMNVFLLVMRLSPKFSFSESPPEIYRDPE
jgi:hypothetical protein